MKNSPEIRIYFTVLTVTISAISISGAGLYSFIKKISTKTDTCQATLPKNKEIELWAENVKKGHLRKSLEFAEKIISPHKLPEIPEYGYLAALRMTGFNSRALTAPFNKMDFLYWRELFEIKAILNGISKKEAPEIEKIFEYTTEKIKPAKKNLDIMPFSVTEIFRQGKGARDSRLRFLCALSAQAEYSPAVILLLKKTGRPFHAFCELRKNDEIYFADPQYGVLLKNVTMSELMRNPLKYFPEWPVAFAKAVKRKKVYCLPVEFPAMRKRNSLLAMALKNSNVKGLPDMMEFPEKIFGEKIKDYHLRASEYIFGYWPSALRAARNYKSVPTAWKTDYDPGIKK
jgi:hypothetical protein